VLNVAAKDYKILGTGTLKGNPSYLLGCETTCGTKQNWELGIYLPPKEVTNPMKIVTKLFSTNLFVKLNPQTTEGGTCTGDWKSAKEPSKHKINITLEIYVGSKMIAENTYVVSGVADVVIPINYYGKYQFTFETNEWGEQCNEPKNTSKKTIYIIEPKTDNGGSGNSGDGGAGDNDELINPLYFKYVIASAIGAGAMIAISSIMSPK
tara:strand:+ start:297 stop:920 length:624 start_codon:yes stop_codon:yes gene_type:complete